MADTQGDDGVTRFVIGAGQGRRPQIVEIGIRDGARILSLCIGHDAEPATFIGELRVLIATSSKDAGVIDLPNPLARREIKTVN